MIKVCIRTVLARFIVNDLKYFYNDASHDGMLSFKYVTTYSQLLQWNSSSDSLPFEGKNNWPKPASFCLFPSCSQYNDKYFIIKKHRWCAWDSNQGPQDGRRRQIH